MTTQRITVVVCREDNPFDVDEAYGAGTYARLFPSDDERCPDCGAPFSDDGSCACPDEIEVQR